MMKELTGKPKKKESFVQVLLSTARLVLAAMMPSGERRPRCPHKTQPVWSVSRKACLPLTTWSCLAVTHLAARAP